MSNRAEDVYGYVATDTITTGMVTAFNAGDPVPDGTVKDHPEWKTAGLVVKRDEWDKRPADEPERPMARGDMPPHLQDAASTSTAPAAQKSSSSGKSTSGKPNT